MRGIRTVIAPILVTVWVVAFAPTQVFAATAFLNNWFLNTTATGGSKTQINEFLDIDGPSYIVTTCTGIPCNGTFKEYIALHATGHDGGASLGLGSGEVTAIGTISGSLTTTASGGSVKFTSGSLDVYAQTAANFATTAGIYGANDGTKIATFQVVDSGLASDGSVNAQGVPNGEFTLLSVATFLAPGFWLDSNSNALPVGTTLGATTTNASFVRNPSTIVKNELVQQFAGKNPSAPGFNTPPSNFIVSDNGQQRLATEIPEPSTCLLLGAGLLALVGFKKRWVR